MFVQTLLPTSSVKFSRHLPEAGDFIGQFVISVQVYLPNKSGSDHLY